MDADLEFELYLESVDPLADYMAPGIGSHITGGRGEQLMRCMLRSQGWSVMIAPYHRVGSHGPDAIAWKRRRPGQPFQPRMRLLILDNKAGRTSGLVSRASGLTAQSLTENLPRFIYALRNAGPQHAGVTDLLEQTRRAAMVASARAAQAGLQRDRGRINLPVGVRLIVTNANGNATGIAPRLRALGIGFGNLRARRIPTGCRQFVDPPAAGPPVPMARPSAM
jgi:hypothetical protein